MKILPSFLIAICGLIISDSLQARIIHVPTDSATIQTGINGAVGGDTVLVDRGHYYERLDLAGTSILITSNFIFDNDTTTIASTIIDGENTGFVVVFPGYSLSSSILNGFTITNGYSTERIRTNDLSKKLTTPNNTRTGRFTDYGGSVVNLKDIPPVIMNNVITGIEGDAIYCEGWLPSTIATPTLSKLTDRAGGIYCWSATPTIKYNIISNNSGSGIVCMRSSPTINWNNIISNGNSGIRCDETSSPIIEDNLISGNSAAYGGGGIICGLLCSPIIRNNIIDNNFATYGAGGGILCGDINSSPTISSNVITGNSTNYDGGGIGCTDLSSPVISSNLISRNIAGYGGGGIYCFMSSPMIRNNEISYNEANYNGGGISCVDTPSPIIQNNTVKYNITGTYGGGVSCYDFSSPTLNNNIITKNSAGYKGSGIFCGFRAKPTISNNIILWNLNGYAMACTTESYPAIHHNNIWNNTDGDFYNCPEGVGDTTWGTNFNNTHCDSFYNIIKDPIFADTLSFELLCNSPCIDAGDPSIYVRPDSGGCRIDMGAHEYPYTLGDAKFDSIVTPAGPIGGAVNIGDIVFMVNYLYRSDSPPCPYHSGDTNCDGIVDIADVICLINYLFKGGELPC